MSQSFNQDKSELLNLNNQLEDISELLEKTNIDNDELKNELNEINTVCEKESVKVNLLQKQLSNQEQQKNIIDNLHNLESSFASLKNKLNQFDL